MGRTKRVVRRAVRRDVEERVWWGREGGSGM